MTREYSVAIKMGTLGCLQRLPTHSTASVVSAPDRHRSPPLRDKQVRKVHVSGAADLRLIPKCAAHYRQHLHEIPLAPSTTYVAVLGVVRAAYRKPQRSHPAQSTRRADALGGGCVTPPPSYPPDVQGARRLCSTPPINIVAGRSMSRPSHQPPYRRGISVRYT